MLVIVLLKPTNYIMLLLIHAIISLVSVCKGDEEFDELCFDFGIELDEVVCKSVLLPGVW